MIINMKKGYTCMIQDDILGFHEVNMQVIYLESSENCKIWLNRLEF